MNIDVLHSSYACSGLIIGAMGEVGLCGPRGGDPDNWGAPKETSYDEFLRRFEKAISKFKDRSDYDPRSFAIITAMTSQHQPETEKILKKIGFKGTKRIKKEKNPDSDVIFWVMSMADFMDHFDAWKAEKVVKMEEAA